MTAVDWPAVRARLLALLERDPEQGATAPPLTEQQVAEAEAELGTPFPPDYRAYLLRVSAGGWFLDELRRTEHGWGWRNTHPGTAPGLAFIADRGEGAAVGLALTGPRRGTVWMDNRPARAEVYPLRTEDGREATFTEWLLDWLAHAEELAGATPEQRGQVAYCWHMGVETPIDWCPPPASR